MDELPQAVLQQSFSFKDSQGIDKWESWTPVRVGWTDTGTPTVTGRFHVIGKQCFVQVEVVPATNIATTAGTSYIELPIESQGLSGDGSMVNQTTNIAVGSCAVDVTNSRVYVPTQGASGDTFSVSAWYEIM